MSSKRDFVTFISFLITLFLILSFLEIRAERRQKSISVELSFAVVFAFRHHVSAAQQATLVCVLLQNERINSVLSAVQLCSSEQRDINK